MRIVLFTDTFVPEINGVATSTATLAQIFIKKGHQVIVVTTNPFSNQVVYENGVIRIPGLELKAIYGYRLTSFYNKKVAKFIKNFNPDIIHVQTDVGVGIFGRKLAHELKVPLVYTYHTMTEDYTSYVTKGHADRIARFVMRKYCKNVIEDADEFISPSFKTKDYMRRIGIDGYANVIPTGVDFAKFNPKNINPKAIQSIKERLGLKDDEFIVLSLGRLGYEKSVDVCIDGYNQFITDHPKVNSKLVIVGWGPAEPALKEQAKKLGIEDKVVFAGKSDPKEVQNYYAIGDAFVGASLTETQGLTYMEAMAANLYVLARYDHNLLSVIQDDVTGCFFETTMEFSNKLFAIYNLYSKGDRTMLDKALKIIEPYSIEIFYADVLEVYKRAIKKNW